MAPKGNKNALGNNGGRPSTVSRTPEEMIALGKEMVKWVEEHKPLHLNEWFAIEKMILYNEWKAFQTNTEFAPYYKKALAIVSKNYIDGTINSSIAHRFMNVYFKDVKEEEQGSMTFKLQQEYEFKKNLLELELKLKANTDGQVNEEIKGQYRALMNQFSQLQSDRKIDDSNSNAAAKS